MNGVEYESCICLIEQGKREAQFPAYIIESIIFNDSILDQTSVLDILKLFNVFCKRCRDVIHLLYLIEFTHKTALKGLPVLTLHECLVSLIDLLYGSVKVHYNTDQTDRGNHENDNNDSRVYAHG